MSVIIKHRTDLDVVAARVGARAGGAGGRRRLRRLGRAPWLPQLRSAPTRPVLRPRSPTPGPRGSTPICSQFADELRERGHGAGDLGAAGRLRRAAADQLVAARSDVSRGDGRDPGQVAGGPPRCSTWSSTASSSAPPRPRRPAQRRSWRARRAPPAHSGEESEIDIEALRRQIAAGAAARATRRRCATSRAWRSPRSAAARARGCSASTSSASAARSACAPSPSPTCPPAIPDAMASLVTSCAASRPSCAASSSAA